ncbi:hypothetical protein [Nodosilinea sp. E11]|uniref:hypothetical protein n=1 Tax=Nodosilinea sp. E11 TaxID=3037479 RepID=UPI0029351676|nr:hypothetical protein [Nodosilinea sp. E11]WOD39354.1 hypothetical protein RRF56_24415 [Nodosilinea sp. E11]
MLTFATPADETQAAQLMQPCLIRVVDNIRKHTETLDWRSEYLEQVRWPGTATAEQRQQVRDLAAQLEGASPQQVEVIRQQLSQLPTPTPAYELRLTQGDAAAPTRTATLDLWELCFEVCFDHYHPQQPVAVDTALLFEDGEINWLVLDEKAKARVERAIDQATAAVSPGPYGTIEQ